ncbi:MAG: PHP domain-containing protein [Candidatus Eisenbacteria bacterium]|nr:PHP domain-containing protein [Candidatus Eisenbacteria bacterium]
MRCARHNSLDSDRPATSAARCLRRSLVGRADLHVHSSASDGLCPPREVVRRAYGVGLDALALTDHDTLAGLAEAAREARSLGIDFLAGCEISIVDAELDVHLLAYAVDPDAAQLNSLLKAIHQGRVGRVREMVRRLRAAGAGVTFEQVVHQAAGSYSIGRMHVARALVAGGFSPSIEMAFARWIGNSGEVYVPKRTPGASEALAAVRAAGGVAVLAHPGLYGIDTAEARFAEWDVDGIEVYHPAHREADLRRLLDWAERRECVVTGGSDWHGDEHPAGYIGSVSVAAEVVAQLRARAARRERA